jgi:8-oxo-dGTP pyrophosphatase MutT (NUDIX family)
MLCDNVCGNQGDAGIIDTTPIEITHIDIIRARLTQALPGPAAQQRMAPRPRSGDAGNFTPRGAAVLLLLYPRAQELHISLIQRAVSRNRNDRHSGQMALPGGKQEPGETLPVTALRESEEEIGINADIVTLLGRLTAVDAYASHYRVHPFVGYQSDAPAFKPNAGEVAGIVEMPVAHLLNPATQQVDTHYDTRLGRRIIPYFAVHGHKVWGVTAMILAEFRELLTATEDQRYIA